MLFLISNNIEFNNSGLGRVTGVNYFALHAHYVKYIVKGVSHSNPSMIELLRHWDTHVFPNSHWLKEAASTSTSAPSTHTIGQGQAVNQQDLLVPDNDLFDINEILGGMEHTLHIADEEDSNNDMDNNIFSTQNMPPSHKVSPVPLPSSSFLHTSLAKPEPEAPNPQQSMSAAKSISKQC